MSIRMVGVDDAAPKLPAVVITATQGTTAADLAAGNHTHPADGTKADKATLINTTAPLTGGGDLSASRTLGVNTFGAAQAGVVPQSGGGTTNYLRADGTWAAPPGAVTQSYVDTQDALRVAKAGDTMTGALSVNVASPDVDHNTIKLSATDELPAVNFWNNAGSTKFGFVNANANGCSISGPTNMPFKSFAGLSNTLTASVATSAGVEGIHSGKGLRFEYSAESGALARFTVNTANRMTLDTAGNLTTTGSINGLGSSGDLHGIGVARLGDSGVGAVLGFYEPTFTTRRAYIASDTSGVTRINAETASTGKVVVQTQGSDRLTVDSTAVTSTLPVVLPSNPTSNLQAATKQYVDNLAYDVAPEANRYVTVGGAGTTLTPSGNDLLFLPVRCPPCSIDALGIEVTTAGSTGSVVRLGIYSGHATRIEPGNLFLDAGTTASTATGVKVITFTSVAWPGGWMWLCVGIQGGASTNPSLRAVTGFGEPWVMFGVGQNPVGLTLQYRGWVVSASGALPNPVGSLGLSVNPNPKIIFRTV